MTVRHNGMEILTEGGLRAANAAMSAGLTVAGLIGAPFFQKLPIPGNTLSPGTRIRLVQYGVYTTNGLLGSVIPRVRLGGMSMLPARTVTGLLPDTDAPWYSVVEMLFQGLTVNASGILIIADDKIKIFGGKPVPAPDLSLPLDLTSTAQWATLGCSITCQAWLANITPPAA